MLVPISRSGDSIALRCPHCGREIKGEIGQYGLVIRESCRHRFEVREMANGLSAAFAE